MMAAYTVNFAKHATLAPTTVDSVTLKNPTSFIIVMNTTISGAPIYFTYGDPTTGVADPTVAGDNTYHVGIGQNAVISVDGTNQLVKLISAQAQNYSVVAV